jgi:hypothetical protein
MNGAWTINVGGKTYGPYSAERMLTFVAEGRLGSYSLVAREGSSDWREARDEPEFAPLFAAKEFTPGPVVAAPAATSSPASSSADEEAKPAPADGGTDIIQPSFGAAHAAEKAIEGKAQFAIIVDLKSRSPGNLEQAIMSLGPAYKLLPNVWIVSTEQTVNAVRNRLVQELGKLDTLFVVDATRGKAAWFNFGPEADVRIRKVWQRAS